MMNLPVEIIEKIANTPTTFKQLLALPPFARYVRKNRMHVLNKFIIIIHNRGDILYCLGKLPHRDSREGPAIIHPNGIKKYYEFGVLHRGGDLPAVEYPNGDKEYYYRGLRHREAMPAIELARGDKEYYYYGKVHRDGNLPAIERVNGTIEYYRGGICHRDPQDGPAEITSSGRKSWYWKGILHRDRDLPAIEYPNGSKCWYWNGRLHRDGGPAVIKINSRNRVEKIWYRKGKLHRDPEDGPAIEYVGSDDKSNEYYMFGIKCNIKRQRADDHYYFWDRSSE